MSAREIAAMSGVGNPLNGQNVNYVAVARLADRLYVGCRTARTWTRAASDQY